MATASNGVPEGWVRIRLRDVVEPSKTKVEPKAVPPKTPYLSLDHIEAMTGRILAQGTATDVRSTKTKFGAGDVLYGRLRPYLNKVAVPDFAGICSTDIMVFEKSTKVDSDYLRWLLSRPEVTEYATHHSTGDLPRIGFRKLGDLEVSLPPIKEQRRLVKALGSVDGKLLVAETGVDRAHDRATALRQAVRTTACSGRLTSDWRANREIGNAQGEVLTAVRARAETDRRDDFAAEATEPRAVDKSSLPEIPDSWTWLYLPDCGYMSRGRSQHRPRNAEHLFGGPYPFIQTGDVARSGGRITSHTQTYNKAGLAQSRIWPVRTVCITIAANIANSALLTYPACFPDSVVGVLPDVCSSEYLESFIRTARADLDQFAPATSQKNINIGILSELAVPIPPRAEQDEIVRQVQALDEAVGKMDGQISRARRAISEARRAAISSAIEGRLPAGVA